MRARRRLAAAAAAAIGLACGAAIGVPAMLGTTAAHATGSTGDPLTCDELSGGEETLVGIVDPQLDDQQYATLWDDDFGFDAQRFTDAGGTVCTWMIGQAFGFVTLAYAPVDEAQADAAISDLAAAGYTRTDTPDGVRFGGGSLGQAAPLDGQHLIADGSWVVVRGISIGSGGVFFIDTDPSQTDALRDRVNLALPTTTPSPTPTPTAAPAAATPPPAAAPTPEPEAPLTADEPSVLSGLAAAGAAPVTAASLTATAGTALVLAALVAIPNRLVDLTAGALAERAAAARAAAVRARRRAAIGSDGAGPATDPAVTDPPGAIERIRRLITRIERRLHPAAGIAIGLIAAGALTALIDPRAGATLGTLRLAASTTLGFAIEGLLGLLAVAWLLRRDGASVAVRFRPVSLLIVLVAIAITRVIGFEPGFVFGVVLALVFLRPSPRHEQRGALIELGYLAAVGVAAWLSYSAVQAAAPPTGPLGLLLVETLAGLTIGCLMALPLLLSPVGDLPGATIWRRSRLLWAGAFVVAMALVVWVVMPFPAAWDAVHTPVIAWVVLLIAYTAAAAIVWALVTKPFTRRADASTDEAAPVTAAPSVASAPPDDAARTATAASPVSAASPTDSAPPLAAAPPE